MTLGNYNPGLKNMNRNSGLALAGLTKCVNGMGNVTPFDLQMPVLPPPPGTPAPTNTTVPGGSAPASTTPRFNWEGLINQSFDFAKTVFLPRGTVIRTPQGTVVRQSGTDQAPVAYQLGQSDATINAGAGFGLAATPGISMGSLLTIGVGAVVLILVLRGGGRR